MKKKGFLGGSEVKNPQANAGDSFPILIQNTSTCPGATKPRHHNYRARALESETQLLSQPVEKLSSDLEPVLHSKRSPQGGAWAPPLK